jgi:hypothetical protein
MISRITVIIYASLSGFWAHELLDRLSPLKPLGVVIALFLCVLFGNVAWKNAGKVSQNER